MMLRLTRDPNDEDERDLDGQFLLLGQYIRLKREKLKLTRAELSELTGINSSSLVRYEKAGEEDGQFPSYERMGMLCRVLNLDPRRVFYLSQKTEDDRQHYIEFQKKLEENPPIPGIRKRMLAEKALSPEQRAEKKKARVKAEEYARKQEEFVLNMVPVQNRQEYIELSQEIDEIGDEFADAICGIEVLKDRAESALRRLRQRLFKESTGSPGNFNENGPEPIGPDRPNNTQTEAAPTASDATSNTKKE